MELLTEVGLFAEILKFVDKDELDTCALISPDFCSARRNAEYFDQTRTGTIIFRKPFNQIPAVTWERWDEQVFTGNRTRLVAVLTVFDKRAPTYYKSDELPFRLTNVRQVIFQPDPSIPVPECDLDRVHDGGVWGVSFFKAITPTLDMLDIGSLSKATHIAVLNFPRASVLSELHASVFRAVTTEERHRFTLWQPSLLNHPTSDRQTIANQRLREFHVNPFGVFLQVECPCPITVYCKELHELEQEEWFREHMRTSNIAIDDYVLLQEYPKLERVTLGRAQYFDRGRWKTLPQEALIKYVRHSPSLRWFCSDLTPENVAMLRAERPEVEFCSSGT